MQTCDLRYKSVEGVALRKKGGHHGSPLATSHRSVASSSGVGDDLGSGDRGGSGKQLIKLGLGEGIGQNEGPVLHAASAENDGGQDLINCSCRLPATHVRGGAVGTGDGHWIEAWL